MPLSRRMPTLDDLLAPATPAPALWDALAAGDDPERAAAAWALSQAVARDPAAAAEWKRRAQAADDADDAAWVVACFLDLTPFLDDVVATALLRPEVAKAAARAMWLHTKRGGALGGAKQALIGAQLVDGVESWAAFALGEAHKHGEDFSDSAADLIRTYSVRWESARIVDDLIGKGLDLSAHAAAVLEHLWLMNDERGQTALRIVKQAVAAGVAIDVASVATSLASKGAQDLEAALRITAQLAAAGADVDALRPLVNKLAKDKRVGVKRAADLTVKALKAAPSKRTSRPLPSSSAVERALADGDAAAIAKKLRGGAKARPAAGELHALAGDIARAKDAARVRVLAEGTVDAVAGDDDVVQFAVIDALAIACGTAKCDLAKHVPALVAALRVAKKPDLAPGSGGWQTRGIAWSARKALAHAVRWGGQGVVDDVAKALVVRAAEPSSYAGHALAEGLARSGRANDVATYLEATTTSAGARLGLLRGLLAVDEAVASELAGVVRKLRGGVDAPELMQLAMLIHVDGARAREDVVIRAARIGAEDAFIRERELKALQALLDDPQTRDRYAGLEGVLVAALARSLPDDVNYNHFLDRPAAGLLAALGTRGASLVGCVDAVAAAWSRRSNERHDANYAACLRIARKQGADIDAVAARLKDKIVRAGAADLLAPAGDTAWTPAQVKALVDKLKLNLRESHPSSFADAIEATAQAASLLAQRSSA